MTDATPIAPPGRAMSLATASGIALLTFLVGATLAALAFAWWHSARPAAPAEPVATTVVQPTRTIAPPPPASTDPASIAAREEMLAAQLAALEQRTADRA